MRYYPDYWQVLKIVPKNEKPVYKLYATWLGLDFSSERWRLNSGIVKVTEDQAVRELHFFGNSGSEYVVYNNSSAYRTTRYTQSVLDELITLGNTNGSVIILPVQDFINFDWDN